MEIMDKLRDVSRSVAAKSGEFAESGKLTLNIRKKEREIRTLELEIGKQVYEAYKNGHIFDEKIAEKCLKIDTVCTEIDRLEAEKEKLSSNVPRLCAMIIAWIYVVPGMGFASSPFAFMRSGLRP